MKVFSLIFSISLLPGILASSSMENGDFFVSEYRGRIFRGERALAACEAELPLAIKKIQDAGLVTIEGACRPSLERYYWVAVKYRHAFFSEIETLKVEDLSLEECGTLKERAQSGYGNAGFGLVDAYCDQTNEKKADLRVDTIRASHRRVENYPIQEFFPTLEDCEAGRVRFEMRAGILDMPVLFSRCVEARPFPYLEIRVSMDQSENLQLETVRALAPDESCHAGLHEIEGRLNPTPVRLVDLHCVPGSHQSERLQTLVVKLPFNERVQKYLTLKTNTQALCERNLEEVVSDFQSRGLHLISAHCRGLRVWPDSPTPYQWVGTILYWEMRSLEE